MEAINGLMIGGPIGAVAGTTLGYLGGRVLDNHIFWSPEDDSDDDDLDGGYDRQGYDRLGFDEDSYDREGYDRKGYDRDWCRSKRLR